jgi:23S rRNA (cytidine1920-2'-O)/16S rRNA (cytidine1409-2'-O)-methyltransferase
MAKLRLDLWMVGHGLTETREKAQALIMAGEVLLNGQKANKSSQTAGDNDRVEVLAKMRYASRGGLKMEGALTHFGIDVTGFLCADFGSSTGGFTDCLLQAGAVRVHCIDVGTGQLDWKLRNDPRVKVQEGVNARYVGLADLGEPVDLAVCDVSFISATLIVPAMVRVLKPETGIMVILVKPQFEVGRGQVGKGGIVRDPVQHKESCDKLLACTAEFGFNGDMMESPITGAEGNREFLLYARKN